MILNEMKFCLNMWNTKGYCSFGRETSCAKCAALYVLWKMLTGEALCGQTLTLDEWIVKVDSLHDRNDNDFHAFYKSGKIDGKKEMRNLIINTISEIKED